MELTRRTVPLRHMNLLIRCDLIMDRGKTWLKFVNRTYKYDGLIFREYGPRGTYHDEPLIGNALNVEPDIVQRERHALNDIIRVLIEVLEELLDVLVPTLEKIAVVDVNDHGFEIFILFLLQRNSRQKSCKSMIYRERLRARQESAPKRWLLTHSR